MSSEDIHTKEKQVWDDLWKNKKTPWDGDASHPALTRLVKESGTQDVPEIPKSGLALVPGCGRGYDVLLFAKHGLDTTGLEISPIAVEAANEYLREQQRDAPLDHRAEVELANFFELERPTDGYSLIYDFTFLCALPPSLRPQWAKEMTRLTASKGLLVTLQFPLDGSDRQGGPPYSLWDGLYHDLLDESWEMIYQKQVASEDSRFPPAAYKPGREKIAVWRRRS